MAAIVTRVNREREVEFVRVHLDPSIVERTYVHKPWPRNARAIQRSNATKRRINRGRDVSMRPNPRSSQCSNEQYRRKNPFASNRTPQNAAGCERPDNSLSHQLVQERIWSV
jgi:hypothetical protein